jgi:hypothetical protein
MNKLPKWQIWLLGLSVGAIIAILLLPQTTWEARSHISAMFMRNVNVQESEAALCQEQPQDIQLQVGEFAQQPIIDSDDDQAHQCVNLQRRFPHSPVVEANIIEKLCRMGLQPEVNPAEEAFIGYPKPYETIPDTPQEGEKLRVIKGAALSGEADDPNNAFFPMILAAVDFAQSRDAEGIRAVEVAGRDSQWNDYIGDLVAGSIRLSESAHGGGLNGTSRIEILSLTLLPQFAPLRSVARVSLWHAVNDEKSGQFADSVRLRRALLHVGLLMRSDSKSFFISNLVGIAIAYIAIAQPMGILPLSDVAEGKESPEQRWDIEIRSNYEKFLEEHGYESNATWLNSQFNACELIRTNRVFRSQLQNNFGLADEDGYLLVATWLIELWAILTVACACLFELIKWASPASSRRIAPVRVTALSVSLVVLLLTLVAARNIFKLDPLADLLNFLNKFNGVDSTSAPSYKRMAYLVVIAPFLLYAMALFVVAWVKRQRAMATLSEVTTKIAAPVTSILVLCFCILIVWVSRQDSIVKNVVAQELSKGEGQYLGTLVGMPWPELTPDPVSYRTNGSETTVSRP